MNSYYRDKRRDYGQDSNYKRRRDDEYQSEGRHWEKGDKKREYVDYDDPNNFSNKNGNPER